MKRLRLMVAWLAACAAAWGGGVAYRPLHFGDAARNGVFAEDLDGDGAPDLVALGLERISIYRGTRGASPTYPAVPEQLVTGTVAYFADVADVRPEPGKELLILTPRGVSCFVHRGGKYASPPQGLLECDTILSIPLLRGGVADDERKPVHVLPWNFAFDADGDGRDDVLVPHGKGTNLYLQKAPGQFQPPITLRLFPLIAHTTIGRVGAKALVGHKAGPVRVQFVVREIARHDVNGDRKLDLTCGDRWYAQKFAGGFDPVPASVPRGFQAAPTRHTVDINGDCRQDRIAEQNTLDDPFSIITRVRYFLAAADGTIPASPTDTIVWQNILVHAPLPVHDFNGDGALDFAMFKTDITVTEVAKWIRQNFGKIDGDLSFFLFNRERNRYERRPAYSKKLNLRFKVDLQDVMIGGVWERYLASMMRFEGDYNADGRLDLLVRQETHAIAIYFNTGHRTNLYGRRPDIVLEQLPMFTGLDVEDLNGDGASDIILSEGGSPFAPAIGRPNVIAAYISQLR